MTDHVRAEEHLLLMNQELKHRVKNTLAMVSAIAGQTLAGTSSDAALTAFQGRLTAFGKAHDTLTATTCATASVGNVIREALEPHRAGDGRVVISGPEITVGAKQALALALSVHELATNATKYGSLSDAEGLVYVTWSEDHREAPGVFRFKWHEVGGPAVVSPTKSGFGTRLVDRVLTADFGGRVEIAYHRTRLVCRLVAPLANLCPDQATFGLR